MANQIVSMAKDYLISYAKEEVSLFVNVSGEAQKLLTTFTVIEAVLENAEVKQVKDPSVRDWLGKLKDAAYDMDDVLDEWRTEKLRRQIAESAERDRAIGICNLVCTHISSIPIYCKTIFFRRQIAHRLKDIRIRLNQIDDDKKKYGFSVETKIEQENEETGELINISETFGRDEEKESIIRKLVSESSKEKESNIPVVSIVGVGGLGKTTLARLVFNDVKVKDHYKRRWWVSVPKDFDAKKVMRGIIKECTGNENSDERLRDLQKCLKECVAGEQFLLVLDDVWNAKDEEWDKLRLPLERGEQGSKILATTREKNVADVMSRSSPIITLKNLPANDCWSLFRLTALANKTKEERSKLKTIGRQIVEKCNGLPLAVRTIASALRSRRTPDEWNLVLRSEIWEVGDVENGILPALLLSYYNMPLHLKPCFAYCAVFPKNYEIKKDELIKLWMAQGFINSENGLLEEKGEWYFNDLLGRSFLQTVENSYFSNEAYQMHDIVHDLAQFVLENRTLYLQNPIKRRHYRIVSDSDDLKILDQLNSVSELRTLLFQQIYDAPTIPFNHLIRLRALKLAGTSIKKLPDSIQTLELLRYLDLSDSEIEELPESISSTLCNLQTLNLNSCSYLKKLPTELWKMSNLRHLHIKGTSSLTYLPKGIGRLRCLRTLSKFIVGGVSELKIGELKNLNLLRGKLSIENLERVASAEEAKEANLEMKEQLHSLILSCDDDEYYPSTKEAERTKRVFESLQPHANLEHLKIKYYKGSEFPSWMVESLLPNLVNITLNWCSECIHLPAFGKFRVLKCLIICGVDAVKGLGREFYGQDGVFPKLEVFELEYMDNLVEWDLRIEDGEMPCLSELKITYAPKLKALPNSFPHTLRKLTIEVYDGATYPAIWSLPCLEELILETDRVKLSAIPSLPNSKLKSLEIHFSYNLIEMPEGLRELKSLEELSVDNCPCLESLREELQDLKALQQLTIDNCPLLIGLCEKEVGDEWHNIAHIPRIRIDGDIIQCPEGEGW